MIEQDLFTYLSAQATLTAEVGTRIYPNKMPAHDATYPAITYFKVSGQRETDMDGDSDLKHPRYQFNCWGRSYADAKEVAEALRTVLHAKRTTMGESDVKATFLTDEADMLNPDTNLPGGNDPLYCVRQDYVIWYSD
jgi:hypothetical protein